MITAAHCVAMDDIPKEFIEEFKISINLGVHNDKTHGQIPTNLPHKSVHVANVIVHPEYKGSTTNFYSYYCDYALQ